VGSPPGPGIILTKGRGATSQDADHNIQMDDRDHQPPQGQRPDTANSRGGAAPRRDRHPGDSDPTVSELARKPKELNSEQVRSGFRVPASSTASGSSRDQAPGKKVERDRSHQPGDLNRLRLADAQELARSLGDRLCGVVDQAGPGVDFHTSAGVFQAFLDAVLLSTDADVSSVPEQESRELLEQLQRLDREFPSLQQARVQLRGQDFPRAAAPKPPEPPMPQPQSRPIASFHRGPGNIKIFANKGLRDRGLRRNHC